MAESVDALVSNTSGATRAGSTPALGTELERSELLSFFCCLPLITHILLTPVGELILCDTFMSTRRQKIA